MWSIMKVLKLISLNIQENIEKEDKRMHKLAVVTLFNPDPLTTFISKDRKIKCESYEIKNFDREEANTLWTDYKIEITSCHKRDINKGCNLVKNCDDCENRGFIIEFV